MRTAGDTLRAHRISVGVTDGSRSQLGFPA